MKYICWCAGIAFAGLVVLSCAPKHAGLLLNTQTVDATTLMTLAQERQDKLRTLVGKGILTFESPELSGTAAFELALKKPDSLLATFEGPFGIDLGTLFVSREKYLVYNSMQNRVVTGVPGTAAIRSIIPFDLTLDQVVGAFSGSFAFPSDAYSLQAYTVDDDMFQLSFSRGSETCRYWVDPQSVLVRKYEVCNAQGESILDATLSSFVEDGEASAPRRIRIKFPMQGKQVSVNYSSITPNDPNPSFTFSIPSNARTTTR